MGAEAMGIAGTRVATGQTVPSSATWAVDSHEAAVDCEEDGSLRPLARSHEAPPCPGCGEPVTWRLETAAPSAAAIEPTSERPLGSGGDGSD